MRDLVNALLLYKSMFVGPWFTALGREEDPETRGIYEDISKETLEQAKDAADLIRRWGKFQHDTAAEEVTQEILNRLLEDMLALKKSSTEVFLAAGIRSPTDELRKEFLSLARVDRRHADTLRDLLGIRIPKHGSGLGHRSRPPVLQPQVGPFDPGTLAEMIQTALEDARAHGHDPARIVMSSDTLRHLRDEGAVESRQGNVFGVPADIDFSWEGEAFAITSKNRLSLAEIVTEMSPEGGEEKPGSEEEEEEEEDEKDDEEEDEEEDEDEDAK